MHGRTSLPHKTNNGPASGKIRVYKRHAKALSNTEQSRK